MDNDLQHMRKRGKKISRFLSHTGNNSVNYSTLFKKKKKKKGKTPIVENR